MTLRVNGRNIPEAAVLNELKRLLEFYSQHLSRAELGEHADELLAKAREHAVGTQLLIEEVKRRHIEVPDSEVEKAVLALVQKAGGDSKFSEILSRQGISMEQFWASVKAGKQLDQLVGRVTSAATECAEEELRAYYEEHPERYATPDQALVRHILMRPASEARADKDATRSQLLDLRHRVMEGEDFADLAAQHSECPSGKEAGGSLGWVVAGMTLPQIDNLVFGMDVGELSDVVETPLGLHILEKVDETQGSPMPFEDVKERIRELLMHERKGKALTEYVAKLREKAVVEDESDDGREIWERVFDSFLDGAKPT